MAIMHYPRGTQNLVKRYISIAYALSLFGFSGCASFAPPLALPPEVSIEEVIEMSRQNVPASTIIAKIDASRTVYHLTSKDIIGLKEQGVAFEIIDFMLQTEKRDITERERDRWRSHYYSDYNDPWYDPFC
jgi:hypothetical protein